MPFWKTEHETPLTVAVINDDVEAVRRIKDQKDQVLATNWLGFNGLELAKYLDRRECLELLEPPEKRTFQVLTRGSSGLKTFTEGELSDFFCIRYQRYLKFRDYNFFKQVVKGCHSIFKKEIDDPSKVTEEMLDEYLLKPELFTIRAHLYRDKIYSGFYAPVTIEWIDEYVEYGVRAARDLKKGEYIGEYTGEMRRWAFWILQNAYSIFYPNKAWQTFCVDAKTFGNEMRFCNHSYKPNLASIAAADRGLIHTVFVADRDISKGEQLTWNYGEEFWSRRDPPQLI